MSGSILDVYDTEMAQILDVLDTLQRRARESSRNYSDFEREIRERFEDIGFTVDINWHNYALGKIVQTGSAMPEVTITGRCDPKFVFDPDQQVAEVTANVLGIPGQEGVIRTDDGEAFRKFRSGEGHGHGHSHSH